MTTNITLATLTGSPKQIAWAESIREKMLAKNHWYAKQIARITTAAWFIRMRDRETLNGCWLTRQIAAERKAMNIEKPLPADYDENEHYYTKLAIYNSMKRNH